MDRTLLLVAVNYNAAQETLEFVKSLSKLDKINQVRIVIVENSIQDFRSVNLKNDLDVILPGIDFVETPHNLNYFGSVNFAIDSLSLKPVDFDFFIISNVDILIKDNTFLTKLFHFNNPEVGVIAPSIFSIASKNDQNPYKRLEFKKSYFYYYRLVYHHIYFTRLHESLANFLRPYKKNNTNTNVRSEYIYAPHGAFIIFLNTYFNSNGSIDFGDLLFCEEIFIGDQCKKIGLKVFYEPALQVLHAEHIATGKLTGNHVRSIKLKTIKHFLKKF